jgi:ABC-type branched-subunit amino acid transport system ATPase component
MHEPHPNPGAGDVKVRVEHVAMRSGRERDLDDITFEVPAREFVCLLGPGGCGTSTILRNLRGSAGALSGFAFDMGDLRPVTIVRSCKLIPDVEAAVLGGNAERLLGTAGVPIRRSHERDC